MKAPPPRLLDDPAALPELRDDLRRSAATGVAYDSAAGLASLKAALVLPTAPPSDLGTGAQATGQAAQAHGSAIASGASAIAGGATAKIVIGALGAAALLVTAATVAWPHARTNQQADGQAAKPSHSAQPAAEPVAPKPVPTLAATPVAATQQATPPAQPTAQTAVPVDQNAGLNVRPNPQPLAIKHSLPADPDGKLRREIAQLARIKALLPSQPGEAYRLAQSGNREFVRGVLAQEREGLAVLALAQLGREREASSRARAFLERFPDSPLRERIAGIASGSAAQ